MSKWILFILAAQISGSAYALEWGNYTGSSGHVRNLLVGKLRPGGEVRTFGDLCYTQRNWENCFPFMVELRKRASDGVWSGRGYYLATFALNGASFSCRYDILAELKESDSQTILMSVYDPEPVSFYANWGYCPGTGPYSWVRAAFTHVAPKPVIQEKK